MQAAMARSLEHLPGFKGISDIALVGLLKRIKEQPEIAEQFSHKRKVDEAHKALQRETMTTLALPRRRGQPFEWAVAHAGRLLAYAIRVSPGFEKLVRLTHERTPSTYERPWRAIIYFDELIPGAVLALQPRRKFGVFYMSFAEFEAFLLLGEAWLCIGVMRSNEVKAVLGGWSAVTRQLLRHTFLGDEGLATLGFLVAGAGDPCRLFAKPKYTLADEDAHKKMLDIKGASGLIVCLKCKNITHNLEYSRASKYLQHTSCSVFRRFDLCTTQTYTDRVGELEQMIANHAGKGQVHDREMEFGMNYNPRGILADRELCELMEPTEGALVDPMHTSYSDGTLSVELRLFMNAAKGHGVTWDHFKMMLSARWNWPHVFAKDATAAVKDCFNDTRRKASDDAFKGQAKDCDAPPLHNAT